MNFGAPIWLAVAGVAAVVVVGLHLLTRRSPRVYLLPTARFLPDRPASAAAPTPRPTDLSLLLLRVTALLLLGAAFARPTLTPARRTHTIVALDRSRAAATGLDSTALDVVRRADLVIAFDSVGVLATEGAESLPAGGGRGSLSVALLAAMRAAPRWATSADSIELVIVSPFLEEEWDAATMDVRRLWPGSIRLVPIAAAVPVAAEGGAVRALAGDPFVASAALLGNQLPAGTRLVRTQLTADDSAWAERGGALVFWPAVDSVWPSVPGIAAGVSAGRQVVVAPFARRVAVPAGRVVARWADGTPAATERPLGLGCERDVGIPMPVAGDIALRPSVLRLVRQLSAPCGGPREFAPISSARLDSLRGGGGMLVSSSIPLHDPGRVPANLWLLIAAGVLLLLEPLFRRSRAES